MKPISISILVFLLVHCPSYGGNLASDMNQRSFDASWSWCLNRIQRAADRGYRKTALYRDFGPLGKTTDLLNQETEQYIISRLKDEGFNIEVVGQMTTWDPGNMAGANLYRVSW